MSMMNREECYLQGIFYLVPKVHSFVHEALEFERLSFEATVKRLQIIDHLESLEYYAGLDDLIKAGMGTDNKKSVSCGQQTNDVYFEFHPFLTRHFVLLPKSKKTKMARRMSYSNILIDTLSKVHDLSDTCHLHESVTKADIVCTDHSGWLTDLSNGKPVWCVVTDMLLCVFENDSVEKSSKVLVLPAFTIKSLVFNSAARSNFNAGDADMKPKDSSRTISGMERFQIVIENDVTGERTVFGTNTKSNLDRWVALLKVASSLDLDVLQHGSECDDDAVVEVPEMTSESWTTNSIDILSKYTPSLAQDVKRTDITLSWLNGQVQGEQNNGAHSPAVVHKIGNLSTLNSSVPSNKWCSTRKSLSPVKQDVAPVVRRAGKSTGALEKTKLNAPVRPMSAMYSYELPKSSETLPSSAGKSSKGFGVKIVRRASLIKEKLMFKSKTPRTSTDLDSTKIENLQDVKISGHLNQKTLLSWHKHWCAISKGILYSFKHKNSTEPADSSIELEKYILSLPTNSEKTKKTNSFKLTRPGGKTLNMAALDTFDLNRWVQALKCETMESPRDSQMSTPELSRIGATERRSSSTSNSVHEFVPDQRRNSVQSRNSSASNAPVLDYPESSDDEHSSVTSSSPGGVGYNQDTPPKHDAVLSQLWQNRIKTDPEPRRNSSLGFDVSQIKNDNAGVLFVPDDSSGSDDSPLSSGDADDVFNDVTVPDITITEDVCSTSYPNAVTNRVIEAVRTLSNSRSCGDLPAACEREKTEDPTAKRLNELNLDCGSRGADNLSSEASKSEKADQIIQQDMAQLHRHRLLQDLQKQRAELERRHVVKNVRSPHVPKTAEIANKYQRAQIEHEQKLVRDVTQLKQRRMSTQLKVDTLEKKLHSQDVSNNNRKSVFGIGGKSKSTLKNEDHKHLKDQLTELKGKLSDLDKGLEDHERQRQHTMKQLQTSETQAIQRLEQHEKLKASLGAIMEVVESPKPTRKTVLDNASIASSTPDGSPGLWRKSLTKHESLSSDFHRRSSNESAGSSSAKSSLGSDSSENKINPNTIAQIEEFEMLAQQVLKNKGAW